MSCLAPEPNKRHCKECTRQGYPEQEIIILTTYGGRDTNILNLDGSKHIHLYSQQKWDWDHYGE